MKIAIISDMHGETLGLEWALSDIQKEGCEAIYCLGDMIHGGGKDEDVVEIIRQRKIPTIFGNHELKHNNELSEEATRFIEGLPERIIFNGTVLSHASPLDRQKITCHDEALHVFENAKFDQSFVGHTHFPFVYSLCPKGHFSEHVHPVDESLHLKKGYRYLVCVGALGDQRSPKIPSQYTIYNTTEQSIRFKLL